MKRFAVVPLIWSLAIAGSCSVKTDRTECPCILGLKLTGGDELMANLTVSNSEGSALGTFAVPSSDTVRTEVGIPRGRISATIVSGLHHCETNGYRVSVPYGTEMDQLFSFYQTLDSDTETLELDAVLHKQYAFVHIALGGSGLESYPFYVRINGNVCGLDIATGVPIPGEFSVTVHPVLGEYHRICLPRQADASLSMDLLNKDGTKMDGVPETRLPLGQYIVSGGYDWSETDLKDIYLDVDYAKASVAVSVVPWNEVEK